ncbi:AAA family ATPase [Methanolacinia paynteri]|uniref:AAA family ATPase n=1 Tax=Methanolacinia paynteri TaxID=230356 RepID=UPI00064E1E2A|nr:SMC family ATPase [Methanolacinia paynteri]
MILERIEFKNFKRYSDETINFNDGITGIIGNNGSGKSTIVQGILFALYGVRAGIEGDFINSSGSNSKDKCSVSLDFQKDGNNYTITRWYRKTPSTTQHEAQLKINDVLLADGVSQVETEIERIVGMAASDFKNTIYAGQKDLSSLLDDSPAERQKWFMKMLGIDFLKKEADARIKTLVDECRTSMAGLGSYLEEKEKENLPEKIDAAAAEMKQAEGNLNLIFNKIKELEGDETELKKKADYLSEKWKEYRELEKDIDLLREANRQKSEYRSAFGKKLAEYEKMLPEFEKPSASEKNYPVVKSKYNEYKEKEKAHLKISSLIENLEYKLNSEKSGLDEINEKIESLSVDKKWHDEIHPEILKRNKLIEEYDRLKKCEDEFRRLENGRIKFREQLKHYTKQAESLRNEIESAEERLKEIGYSGELDSKIEELEDGEKKLAGESIKLTESVKTLDREKKKLSKELDEIIALGEDGECPTCKRRLGDQYRILEDSLKAGIESNENESAELKSKILGIKADHEKALHELDRLKSVRRESLGIISVLEANKKKRQELYLKVEETIGNESKLNEEIVRMSFSDSAIRELERSIKSLDGIFFEYRDIEIRLKDEQSLSSRKADTEGKISDISQKIEDEKKKLSELRFDPEKYRAVEIAFEEAEALHQRYLELKPKIDQIPSLKDEIGKLEEEMNLNSKKFTTTEATLKSMEISEEIVKSALSDVEECRKKISGKKIEAAGLESNIRHLREDLERLEKETADINERKKRYSELQERMVVFEKTRGLMKEYIVYLLNVIRAKIEGEVGQVLSEITGGRYENVLIDENFDILVNDLGENFPARRFSGGEQDDIAIALRIALSRYLADMHHMNGGTFMIFDEIFGSQDEERRSNLISALRTQESHFPQIFLISHIGDIQGEFSTSLLVKIKDDWSSEVIEVSD